MAKQQKLEVYTISDIQALKKKKQKLNIITPEKARVDDAVPKAMRHYEEGIDDEAYRTFNANPFLYDYDSAHKKATSIEEFYIRVKKESLPLGSVFRDSEMKKRKKRKWIRRGFKEWKKDFTQQKTALFKKENDKVFVVGEVVVGKFSIVSIVFLILLLIITNSLLFKIGSIWTILANSPKAFLQKINTGINLAFSASWGKYLPLAVISLTLIALFYAFYHNGLIRDFKRLSKDSQTEHKKITKLIEKDFKRKYKRSQRYYLRRAKKKSFAVAPLAIDKTAVGKFSFKSVTTIADSYVEKAAYLKRNKGKLKFYKFLFTILSFVSGLFVIGYSIYFIIKQFI